VQRLKASNRGVAAFSSASRPGNKHRKILFALIFALIFGGAPIINSTNASATSCLNDVTGSKTNASLVPGTAICVIKISAGTTTWTPPSGMSAVNVLIVAGGGGDGAGDVSPYGYWANAFTLVGNAPFNVTSLGNLTAMSGDEPISGHLASDYFALDPEENSLQVALDPNGQFISGFSDSRNVYKITLESVDHVPGS